jgi:NhaP-type Na+/H+ or K+/H+ antiporter
MPQIAASLVDADGLTRPRAAILVAALSAVAIGVRFLWIFTATYGVRLLVPSIQRADPASARVSTLVSWSGMRGVVSLAAALALPTALESGAPFPGRNLVILLAYGIVFVTLVGQGLTLPVLIRWLGIKPDSSGDDETRLARDAMRRAATLAVDRLVAEHGFQAHDAVAVKRFFNSRARTREEGPLDADRETRLWLGASSAQREALIELWKNGEIGDDVLIALERELDLAEARLPHND